MESPIDLRSDTVTRPTPAMRKAMAEAEVGDDVLGDDPTVIRLQEFVAELMGKEAACFVPTGTMANQTAIRAQTEPGDEIIGHADSHIVHYETAAYAALSGCTMRPLHGPLGFFDVDQLDAAIRPSAIHFPASKLLWLENTHNKCGGSVWPTDQLARVALRGKELGLRRHLDGARIWNACVRTSLLPADYARHFDTISCCFSKGLGAPAGSAVAGDRATIARVHRFRKMFGGTMRQSGVLAAAALYALKHHRERLHEDHRNAQRLAQGLAEVPGIRLDPSSVETNMVFFDVSPEQAFDAAGLCERLKALNVLALPSGPRRIRMVCHLDVSTQMIDRTIQAVGAAMGVAAMA
ncbi:MAG: threonine aldolase family protein [Phycisphaerales bacterium]